MGKTVRVPFEDGRVEEQTLLFDDELETVEELDEFDSLALENTEVLKAELNLINK